jgi:pimeloyl-ACP methyl ester carboxylesterase
MHRVEQGTFRHEGFTLAYEEHGPADGVPIVLMHGILLDAAVNRDLASQLAEAGYRTILLDLLGHGRSDRAEAAELRNDFFGEQVVACLNHLRIDEAIVGGVSLGAIVSLQVAVTAPKRVKALLLEMPVMEESTVFAAILLSPLIFATNYLPWVFRRVAGLLARLPQPRRAVWQSVMNAATQDPEAIRSILHGVMVGPIVPPRRLRRRIEVPALVIGHGGDWLHNLEDSRALAEELPNGRLLMARSILELRTKPERLMPEIVTFLREATGDTVVRLAPDADGEEDENAAGAPHPALGGGGHHDRRRCGGGPAATLRGRGREGAHRAQRRPAEALERDEAEDVRAVPPGPRRRCQRPAARDDGRHRPLQA